MYNLFHARIIINKGNLGSDVGVFLWSCDTVAALS